MSHTTRVITKPLEGGGELVVSVGRKVVVFEVFDADCGRVWEWRQAYDKRAEPEYKRWETGK